MESETQTIIKMHTQLNLSCAEISDILGKKKNTVLQLLRYHNKLKQALGVDVEKQVAEWLLEKSNKVSRQRGDCYWDLMVNGKKVDVKSSQKDACGRYHFAINHKLAKNHRKPDYYILVFKDEKGVPMYSLSADQVNVSWGISLPGDPLKSRKYSFDFVGYLSS